MKIDINDADYGCTIIIPTYNRPEYLRRILSYYSKYDVKCDIIVADSSSSENKKSNEKILSSFSGLEILYLNHYSSDMLLFHKFADVIKYVNTKYCVICADDDFITPNGITQSVDFLEKNLDYTVVHGHNIAFHTNTNGKKWFSWVPLYSCKSIVFPDSESRLNIHLSKYSQPTLYAVHRTDFLNFILKETVNYTNDLNFGELLPSLLASIYGKIKCLDVFYAAREGMTDSLGKTSGIPSDYKTSTYNEKYTKFRNCLVLHLCKNSQLSTEEATILVDDSMSIYMERKSKSTNYKALFIDKMYDISNCLKLPNWIDIKARKLFKKIFLPKQFQMEVEIQSSFREDFNKIRLHVLSSYYTQGIN